MLSKHHPVFRKGINIRRFYFLLAIATQFAIAKVISQNVNDIGFGGLVLLRFDVSDITQQK